MDSATVSKLQPCDKVIPFLKFRDVITQLPDYAFNLTPQTLKSDYGALKKTPRLLIFRLLFHLMKYHSGKLSYNSYQL
jgi:hypothetical protein